MSVHRRRLDALLALEDLPARDREAFTALRHRLRDPLATLDDAEAAAVWRATERHFGHELWTRRLVDEA